MPDWLAQLTVGYDYQPLTWSIAAVTWIWFGIARGQWIAAFVFAFSIVYAFGWLFLGTYMVSDHNWLRDPCFRSA